MPPSKPSQTSYTIHIPPIQCLHKKPKHQHGHSSPAVEELMSPRSTHSKDLPDQLPPHHLTHESSPLKKVEKKGKKRGKKKKTISQHRHQNSPPASHRECLIKPQASDNHKLTHITSQPADTQTPCPEGSTPFLVIQFLNLAVARLQRLSLSVNHRSRF